MPSQRKNESMNQSTQREQMNVVIVGHVDHGKSTLIGRLLADTKALPEGKLEAVKAHCQRNAKPFEYAFLLDALKDEQSQGITIDTARCFFKSSKRDYIIIDAPGHIEFLKNMITGAARAEAAMLLIDAREGIQENSKRHGYMLSFLGIKNITVCVNKMDLVDYDQQVFEEIKAQYLAFLKEINIVPRHVIPVSAREGDNMVTLSDKMPWYQGCSVLGAFDDFAKAAPNDERPFRLPIQDVYKFTQQGDDRRIFAGRVESGWIAAGEEVVFLPSNKTSQIARIEGFNMPPQTEIFAGQSTGVTLKTQVYIRPGEIMCRASDERKPHVSNKFKANIFWMGQRPLVKDKNYKLKVATQQVPVVLTEIVSVLDASELSSIQNKAQVDRHDVAECVFETLKPIAFDEVAHIPETGRFVIVDNYEISGGGIILAPVFDEETTLSRHVKAREFHWERSNIPTPRRTGRYRHKPALVVITGQQNQRKQDLAKAVEKRLFDEGKHVYFLGVPNEVFFSGENANDQTLRKVRYVRQLGEMAHVLTDSGLILLTSVSDLDEYELEMLKALNQPHQTIVVNVGENRFSASTVALSLPEITTASALGRAVDEVVRLVSSRTLPDPEYSI